MHASAACLLLPHATLGDPLAERLEVSFEHNAAALRLTYRVRAAQSVLRMPSAMPAGAADGLWEHTCLELFVRCAGGEAYREFNFSPSGQWAIYDFSAYRQRDVALPLAACPKIDFQKNAAGFVLTVTVDRCLLPGSGPWQMGLSAVLEAGDGRKAYWAAGHAAARPDFHSNESFCLDLPNF